MKLLYSVTAPSLMLAHYASAITVAEITGNRYLSPIRESSLTNLTGLITFTGFSTSIRSLEPDDDESTSESIGVLGFPFGEDHAVGDIVTIDGKV